MLIELWLFMKVHIVPKSQYDDAVCRCQNEINLNETVSLIFWKKINHLVNQSVQ